MGCSQGTTCVGHPTRRHAEGGQCGGWRLRAAAVAYCEACDLFVKLGFAVRGYAESLASVLCPETLQPPKTPDGGGTTTGRRRTNRHVLMMIVLLLFLQKQNLTPSAAGRRKLCFARWRWRTRQHDASRVSLHPACDGGALTKSRSCGDAHSVLRARFMFDYTAAWTWLMRVARGRRPRRWRRGWLACAAGEGGNFD